MEVIRDPLRWEEFEDIGDCMPILFCFILLTLCFADVLSLVMEPLGRPVFSFLILPISFRANTFPPCLITMLLLLCGSPVINWV